MSAMHWEARRRQSMLDRRLSRSKQVDLQNKLSKPLPKLVSLSVPPACRSKTYPQTSPESPSEALKDTSLQPAENLCVNCKRSPVDATQYGPKLQNRYNSVQYSQQW